MTAAKPVGAIPQNGRIHLAGEGERKYPVQFSVKMDAEYGRLLYVSANQAGLPVGTHIREILIAHLRAEK